MPDYSRADLLRQLQQQKKQIQDNGNSLLNPSIEQSVSMNTNMELGVQKPIDKLDTSKINEESGYNNFLGNVKAYTNELENKFLGGFLGALEGIVDFGATAIGSITKNDNIIDWTKNDMSTEIANLMKYYGSTNQIFGTAIGGVPSAIGNTTSQIIKSGGIENYANMLSQKYKDLGAILSNNNEQQKYRNINLETNKGYDAQNGVDNFVFGLTESFGNMLPSIMVGSAVQGLGGSESAAKALNLTTFGLGAAGSSTQEALNDGATNEQAMLYGTVKGGIEVASEVVVGKALNGIASKTGLDKLIGKFSSNVNGVQYGTKLFENASKKGIAKEVTKSMFEEGTEEVFSDILSPLAETIYKGSEPLKQYVFGNDENKEYLKGIGLSFLSGAVMGGISSGTQEISKRNTLLYKNVGEEGIDFIEKYAQLSQAQEKYNKYKLDGKTEEYIIKKIGEDAINVPKEMINDLNNLEQNDHVKFKNLLKYLSNAKETELEWSKAKNNIIDNLDKSLTQRYVDYISGKLNTRLNTETNIKIVNDSELEKLGIREDSKAFIDSNNNNVYIKSSSINEINSLIIHEAYSHAFLDLNQKNRDNLISSLRNNKEFNTLWNKTLEDVKKHYGNLVEKEESLISETLAIILENNLELKNIISALDLNTKTRLKTILQKAYDFVKKNAYRGDIQKSVAYNIKRFINNAFDSETKKSVIENYLGIKTNNNSTNMVVNGDGTISYSINTDTPTAREFLRKELKNNKYSDEDIDVMFKQLDNLKQLLKDYAKVEGFKTLNQFLFAEPQLSVVDGKPILSCLIANGEYVMNFDFSATCKKRVEYQKILEWLANNNFFNNSELFSGDKTANTIKYINDVLTKNGIETPCKLCFVESRRLFQRDWAKSAYELWNRAVEYFIGKTNERYNFGSYAGHYFGQVDTKEIEDAIVKYRTNINEKVNNKVQEYGKTRKLNESKNVLESNYQLSKKEIEFMEAYNEKGEISQGGSNAKVFRIVKDIYDNGGASALKMMGYGDLLSSNGLSEVKKLSPEFFAFLKSSYGAGTPKMNYGFSPYNHEIFSLIDTSFVKTTLGKTIKGYDTEVKRLNKLNGKENIRKNKIQALRNIAFEIGGIRLQSFSDAQITQILDIMQLFSELSAWELPNHTYTKEAWEVGVFGLMGAKFNMSLISTFYAETNTKEYGKYIAGLREVTKDNPSNDGLGIILEVDEKGNPIIKDGHIVIASDTSKVLKKKYTTDFIKSVDISNAIKYGKYTDKNGKPLQSFPYDKMLRFLNDEMYSKNCGSIAIGFSEAHMLLLLQSKNISMVIPYHKSGVIKAYAKAYEFDNVQDYTDYQNTEIDTNTLYIDGKKFNGKSLDKTIKNAILGSIDLNYNSIIRGIEDSNETPILAANEYIRRCKEGIVNKRIKYNGEWHTISCNFIPKFNEFSSNKNYYKLLTDFALYDCNGNYSKQRGVRWKLPYNWYNDFVKTELKTALATEKYNEKAIEDSKKDIEDHFKNVKYSLNIDENGRDVTPFSENNNYGYHAGDLGKAEDYYKQSGGRNTGHFGTGTWFVGNPEKIKNYNDNQYGKGKAPHHQIVLDNYNLYKPSTNQKGFDLNDALGIINNTYGIQYSDEYDIYKWFIENRLTYLSKYDDEYKIKKYLPQIIDKLEKLGVDFGIEKPNITDKEYDRLYDKYFDEIDKKEPNIDIIKKFDYVSNKMKGLISEETYQERVKDKAINYINYSLDRAFYRIEKFDKMVDKLQKALEYNFSKLQIENALNKVDIYYKNIKEKGGWDYLYDERKKGNKLDSLSTIFMKSLGYDGVDVRHLNKDQNGNSDLDNTGWGSVVYDLKPESIKYSLDIKDGESFGKVTFTNDDLEKQTIKMDKKGRQEYLDTYSELLNDIQYTESPENANDNYTYPSLTYIKRMNSMANPLLNYLESVYDKDTKFESEDIALSLEDAKELQKIIEEFNDKVGILIGEIENGDYNENSKLLNPLDDWENDDRTENIKDLWYYLEDSIQSIEEYINDYEEYQTEQEELKKQEEKVKQTDIKDESKGEQKNAQISLHKNDSNKPSVKKEKKKSNIPSQQVLKTNYINWNKEDILSLKSSNDIIREITNSIKDLIIESIGDGTEVSVDLRGSSAKLFDIANFNEGNLDKLVNKIVGASYKIKFEDVVTTTEIQDLNTKEFKSKIKNTILSLIETHKKDTSIVDFKTNYADMIKELRTKVATSTERIGIVRQLQKRLDILKDEFRRNVELTDNNAVLHTVNVLLKPFSDLKYVSSTGSYSSREIFQPLQEILNKYTNDEWNNLKVNIYLDGNPNNKSENNILKVSIDPIIKYDGELRALFEKLNNELPIPRNVVYKNGQFGTAYGSLDNNSLRDIIQIIDKIRKLYKEYTTKELTENIPTASQTVDAIERRWGKDKNGREKISKYWNKYFLRFKKDTASSYAIIRDILGTSKLADIITIDMPNASSNALLYEGDYNTKVSNKIKELKIDKQLSNKYVWNITGKNYKLSGDQLVYLYNSLHSKQNYDAIKNSGLVYNDDASIERTIIPQGNLDIALDYLDSIMSNELIEYAGFLKNLLNKQIKVDYIKWYVDTYNEQPNEIDDYWMLFRQNDKTSSIDKAVRSVTVFNRAKERIKNDKPIRLGSATNAVSQYVKQLGIEKHVKPVYKNIIAILNTKYDSSGRRTLAHQLYKTIGKENFAYIKDVIDRMVGKVETNYYGWLSKITSGYSLKVLSFNVGSMLKQYASIWTSNLPVESSTKALFKRVFGNDENFKKEYSELVNEIGSVKYRKYGGAVEAEIGDQKVLSILQKPAEYGMKGITWNDYITITTGLQTLMYLGETLDNKKIGTEENKAYVKEHWNEFIISQIASNPLALNEISKGKGAFGMVSKFLFGFMQGANRVALSSQINKINIYNSQKNVDIKKIENNLVELKNNLKVLNQEKKDLQDEIDDYVEEMRYSGYSKSDIMDDEEYQDMMDRMDELESNILDTSTRIIDNEVNIREHKEFEIMGGAKIPLNIIKGLLVQGLFVTLVNELLKHLKGKKDWDDWEFINNIPDFLLELILNSTVGWIPVINVIANKIFSGYDVEVASATVLSDIFSIGSSIYESVVGLAKGEGFDYRSILSAFVDGTSDVTGFPIETLTQYITGVVRVFDSESALKMRNIFYGYASASEVKYFNEYVENGNTKSAVRQLGFVMDTYKVHSNKTIDKELTSLKTSGYNAIPKDFMTSYVNDNGKTVNLKYEQLSTFKTIYNRSNDEVYNLIEKDGYNRLTQEQKAKVIKKIYDAYYGYAKAKTIGTSGSSKLENLLLYTNGNIDIASYVLAMNMASSITETNNKTKKELVIEYINKLNSYTKQEKLLILHLMGYSMNDSNKNILKRYLSQNGMSNQNINNYL